MKHLNYIILILAIITGCTYADDEMTIMSFNIKHREKNEGVNRWENRRPIVSWFLNDISPDIIGLQSLDKNQLVGLEYALSEYKYVGAENVEGAGIGIYNPIFYKANEFDLISKSQFWLSETPDSVGSKGWGSQNTCTVTWGKFRNRDSGHIFYLFNTEFPSDNQEARIESAKLLLQKVKLIADNAPVIITGSIFSESKDSCYQILTGSYIDHYPFSDAENIATKKITNYNATYNAYSQDVKLKYDYIFVNEYFSVYDYSIYPVKKDNIFISDHYPLMATLIFNSNTNIKVGNTLNLQPAKQLTSIKKKGLKATSNVSIQF